MKIAYIQPPYPFKGGADVRDTMDFILQECKKATEGTDLLVLPEYSNCPGINDYDEIVQCIRQEGRSFMEQLPEIARTQKMNIVVNMVRESDGGLENVSLLYNRDGVIQTEYVKTHPTLFERESLHIRPGRKPAWTTLDGDRIAFATCFDLYFPEYFEHLASMEPDLIVIPTYQRSEQARVIRIQASARAIDTGAYLLRCSYSMGDASDTGGHSMLVHPNGEVISDAGQRAGLFEVSADLKDKWQRPKSFGTGTAPARSVVEEMRRPRVYRPNRQYTAFMTMHPRVVAHRGFSKACPENTLPAFAAAIALGAHEIELDIRPSLDRELVIHHDAAIKLADGRQEQISSMKWDEVQSHDMGASFSEAWRGVRITRFNDVLQAFAGQAMFNVHVKDPGEQGFVIREIKRLAEQFDIVDHIYIAGNRPVMEAALQYAPEIMRCCLVEQSSWNLVDHAIHFKCDRLQFFNKYCSEEMIAKAHAAGISCNLFYTDKAEEAEYYYRIGIDNILTNAVSEIIPVAARLSK